MVRLPTYLRILQALRSRIAEGKWRVGDQIPTDEELMQRFGVSRFTVRAALDVLVADGVIKRFRKRGTFVVARPQGAGTWMLTSLDDLVLSGFPTSPILLDATETSCTAQIAGALGLEDASPGPRIRCTAKGGLRALCIFDHHHSRNPGRQASGRLAELARPGAVRQSCCRSQCPTGS